MEAFIGLLRLLEVLRVRYRNVNELWSVRDGFSTIERELREHRMTSCLNRVQLLLSFM